MIGDMVRALREKRSWTQAHLAEAAGLSLRTVQRLEAEQRCAPETLLALAAAFDIDVAVLTEGRASTGAAWPGPEPRRAALWGLALAMPCALFVAVNLLKFGLGLALPYDLLAAAGGHPDLAAIFDLISPFLFLGGPIAAILINLRATVRPRLQGSAIVALEYRLSLPSLAILMGAGAAAAILCAYLVAENLGHVARGVL